MAIRRGRQVIIEMPTGGIDCCCIAFCTCIHWRYIKTGPGKLKLAEIILGFSSQGLAIEYGSGYFGSLGYSFQSFLSNGTWSFMTSLLLLICYIFSPRSMDLIKSSIFEILFNIVAAISHLSTGSYLGYVVNLVLKPIYFITPDFIAYPLMMASFVLGSLLGLLYAYDAFLSYRYFKARC